MRPSHDAPGRAFTSASKIRRWDRAEGMYWARAALLGTLLACSRSFVVLATRGVANRWRGA